MFLFRNGRPSISCDKCRHWITIGETLALTYHDLESVTFVCAPCADLLAEQWREKGVETMPVLVFFEKLLAGRARAAVHAPQTQQRPAPALPPPPSLEDYEIAIRRPLEPFRKGKNRKAQME